MTITTRGWGDDNITTSGWGKPASVIRRAFKFFTLYITRLVQFVLQRDENVVAFTLYITRTVPLDVQITRTVASTRYIDRARSFELQIDPYEV